MGRFPEFGSWINQNIQQSPKVNYEEEDEEKQQSILWSDAERKHPWYDAPPRVKVTKKNGLSHMNIELTMGVPPEGVWEFFTNPVSIYYHMGGGQQLLEHKSRKVLKKDGPRESAKLEKTLPWNFLWWSGSLPVTLIVDENKKDFSVRRFSITPTVSCRQ